MYTTYDIFDDLLGMRNWVDRYFNEPPSFRRRIEYPYVNLYENDDTVEVAVIAPGIRNEDLNIELHDEDLIIKGEKKTDKKENAYIRSERRFGKFHKNIRLPYRVDTGKIEAKTRDGILYIKLVKSEAAKPKKIEIH